MENLFEFLQFNTPIVQIPDVHNKIYVKRDDLLPFSFGGNKVRIALEFLNDMKRKGYDCIVGYGNARSNLSRALANVCYKFHIPCHIISPADEDGTRIYTFNSRMAEDFQAQFHYCQKTNVKETVERVIADLKSSGLNPYYIYGNSSGEGNEHIPIFAYKRVYEEIKNNYDYIFLATGTGMTQGGLIAGRAINNGSESIVGISVARSETHERLVLQKALKCFSERVQLIENYDIEIVDTYLCNGYGTYNQQIVNTIHQQLVSNGMPLDPTYTGKAFWGMLDYLKRRNISNKKILFIHTGGTPLFFDYMMESQLINLTDPASVLNAVNGLGNLLVPSLTERNVDIPQYSLKLSSKGKVWCHYAMGEPISIIAGYFNDSESSTAYISILAVAKEYQGRGLASSLLFKFEDYAKLSGMNHIKLEVRKNNNSAQEFYHKHGFKELYEASYSSIYMVKELFYQITK